MTREINRRQLIAAAGAAALTASAPRAFAQTASGYPNKPLKIIVGAAPGGLSDGAATRTR